MAQIKIAEYTFDNSVGDCLPTLTPNTITMTSEDTVSGTTTRRIVYIDDTTMPSRIAFGQYNSLLAVDYINMGSHITSCNQMFYRSLSLKSINTSNWDLPNVTSYGRFIMDCSKLESIDFSFATRTKTVNFYRAFEGLSTLHTITGMQGLTIDQLVINITTLKKLDLTGTTMVHTNFNKMFNNCQNLTEIKGIENWDVSSVTDFGSMFNGCKSLTKLDLRNWVTSSATDMSNMFSGCSSLEVLRVDNFDTSDVGDNSGIGMSSMFYGCSSLKTLNLNSFTRGTNLTKITGFLKNCESLEYFSMQNFDFSGITTFQSCIQNCKSLKMLDLTMWDTSSSSTATFTYCFNGVTCPIYYNSNICTNTAITSLSNAVDVQGRLMAIYDFNNTVTTSDSAYPTLTGSTVTKKIDTQGSESNITHRVIGVDVMPTAISFNSIRGLLNVDYLAVTSSCTQLGGLFDGCASLESINTFGWDTSNVQGQNNRMFSGCSQLKELDMTWFNTSKITMMRDMFSGCSKLTELDLSSFNTENVISFQSMFNSCANLVTLNVSSFNTEKCTHFPYMFWGCTSLQELDLTSFNTTKNTMGDSIFNLMTSNQIVYVHDTNWTIYTSNATVVRRLSKLIAKYTFDNSIGDCLPTITGITTSDYKVSDIVNDTITTRLITSENVLPTRYVFKGIKSLTRLEYLEMSEVTNMQDMLSACSNLEYLDVSQWNTSKVTNMYYAFIGCAKLTEIIGIEDLDVSNCTNLTSLFESCSGLTSLDLSKWNVTKCTKLNQLFFRCTSLVSVNLSGWNTTNNTKLTKLFCNCNNLTEIIGLETWDTSNVTTMLDIFGGCNKITSIEMVRNWNTSKVANMSGTFSGMTSLTSLEPILNWDTSKVTDMANIFSWLKVESFSFANWDTSKVGNMYYMLAGLPLDGWDISNLDTSSANNMSNMFESCTVTGNLDLSFFDVRKVTNMTNMFAKANISDTIILDNWDLNHNATNIAYMFPACKAQHISFKWKNTDKITSLKDTFNGCPNLISLDFSSWDTTSLTNIQNTFMGCGKLAEVDLSSFDFRNKNVATGQMFLYSKTDSTVYYDPALFKLDPYSIGGVHATQSWVVRPSKNNGYWLDMTGITEDTTITMVNYNKLPTEDILTDWGDGTQNSELTHTYSTAGEYVIATNLQHNESLRPYTVKANLYHNASLIGLFMGFAKLTELTFADNFITECNSRTQTSFERMFNGCWALSYLPSNFTKLNFSNVANVASMLNYSGLKEVDLTGWTTNNVKSWGSLFNSCKNLEKVNFGNVDFSENTSTNSMFVYCSKLTSENINFGTGWTTSNVTDMASMFNSCSSLTSLDLSSWNTSKVTTINKMFWKCTGLTDCSFIESWDFSSMDNMVDAFAYSGIKTFNFRNKTLNKLQYCATMLAYNTSLESVDFSGTTMTYNGGGIGNPTGMFDGCTNLKTANFDNMTFIPKNCTNMFKNCSSLTSLDLSSWDTSQCANMSHMFFSCVKLKYIDLSSFNTINTKVMTYMFENCQQLQTLDLSSFTFNSDCNCTFMFVGLVNLKMLDISNYSTHVLNNYMLCNTIINTVGMLYSSADSINFFTSNLLRGDNSSNDPYDMTNGLTIYYYDADPSQLTPVEGVTFKKYAFPTTIQLPPHIQLHSLPDGTRDEVDIKTGILTRRTNEIIVNGSENWQIHSEEKTKGVFKLKINDNDSDNHFKNQLIINVICSDCKFKPVMWNNSWNLNYNCITGVSNMIYFYDFEHKTLNEFKQYLSENPIKAIYRMTPTTEQLILNYNNSCDYGRILLTGMCDKYDVVNSMYTQTMTSILLDGANTWDAMEEFENTVKFTATGTTVGVENLNMLGAGGLYCDNNLFPNINDDSDVPHCRVDEAGNKFYIYVDKEMLMSPDLIGWQIWLQANKFNMIYELAEHLTYVKPYEKLDATQARWEGMDCMRDGTIKYHTNNSDNITMYPTLEYVAPSINNFEVTMLEPNTDYTIYAEGINTNDTINLGGTDINFNNGTVYASGDNQWLRIDNNDSFYNMVITKGDTTGEVVPYFEGMTSVENPKVRTPIVVNGLLSTAQGKWESNSNFGGSVVYVPMIDVKVGQKYIIASSSQILVAVWRSKTWVNDNVTQIEYADVLPDRPLIFTPDVSQVAIFMVVAKHLTDKAHEVELRMYEGEVDYGYLGRVENPKVIIERSTVSYTDLKLRSLPNGVKDTINVVTGEYVQRVGEMLLNGNEDWVLSGYENSLMFYVSLNNLVRKEDYLNSISCDKFVTYTDERILNDSISLNGISAYADLIDEYPNENWLYIKHADSESSVEKFKQWLKENPVTVQYELAEPITTKLDPQTLLAYTDGTINLSSDTGLLPTTHYTVPSTNTFHLPSMKTGTRYTLKYPSASGSITIGDITYKISGDSMLFTTPLKINGDTSAIIFSDANPENVVLLEGAYNKREVPFFTGVKSVKNPNITITDQLSTESTTYNCETEIELRGLPNGVADKLDIIKGKLTTNVGIRPYQEGDENLPNVWTDGYETVYGLSSPVVTNVAIDNPTVTTNSLIELSSDYLIPQLNYRAPSSNNFPLDLLQPNTTYTLYADTLISGSYTLGGTKTGIYSQPHTITLGDMTDNLLTFNGDLGLSNVMLVKGNSLKTTLPPYFLGIRSVTDGHLLVEGMAGEMNELTFDEGIVLRDCNGVKDTIDLITCTLTKRTGEITLTGAEGWFTIPNESVNAPDDYVVFALTLQGVDSSNKYDLICDTITSKYLYNKPHDTESIYGLNNSIRMCVKKSRIGGDTVNALKSWLNQNPTTVVYSLKTPLEVQLENVWTTTPPTSYSNQTEISSTVSTNSLKPMISVTIATTTLEEIVSNLETRNAQLEEENLATMLALTEVYEMMYMSTVDDTEPTSVSTWNRRIIVSSIGMVYAKLVKRGVKSIEDIPTKLQVEVQYAIDNGLV